MCGVTTVRDASTVIDAPHPSRMDVDRHSVGEVQEDRQCTAHRSSDGKRCQRWAIRGGTVCRTHGGAKAAVKAAAAKRVATAVAEKEMRALGVILDDMHPLDALLGVVREAAGNVAVLRGFVSAIALDDPEASSGLTRADCDVRLKMYGEWCDRLAKYSKLCLDAGVDERKVRMAEGQGAAIVAVIASVIDAPGAGLTEEQRDAMRKVAARKLRELGGAAGVDGAAVASVL